MRSPQLSEKMPQKREFEGFHLKARSSHLPANPFEITAFFGAHKIGEKIRETASGGAKRTGFQPSLVFFQRLTRRVIASMKLGRY